MVLEIQGYLDFKTPYCHIIYIKTTAGVIEITTNIPFRKNKWINLRNIASARPVLDQEIISLNYDDKKIHIRNLEEFVKKLLEKYGRNLLGLQSRVVEFYKNQHRDDCLYPESAKG